MPDLTVPEVLGCPTWCRADHDRDLADPTLAGTLLHDTPAGQVAGVSVSLTATSTEPAHIDVDIRHAGTSLTPGQARALAGVLLAAAATLDPLAAIRRRDHPTGRMTP